MRQDGRTTEQLRPVRIVPGFIGTAPGSALIEWGHTRVICTCTVEEKVPPFLLGAGQGWVTAEYGMLPGSTLSRKRRTGPGNYDGRGSEIGRLIGRSLRAAVDRSLLGERTLYLDCDVIEADGGTRTASITGAYVALRQAVDKLLAKGLLEQYPILRSVAAVSVGIVGDALLADLCYGEDSQAQVDMNLVYTGDLSLVEVQGTGEGRPFTPAELVALEALGRAGAQQLFALQQEAIASWR